MKDNINPNHYKNRKHECIEFTRLLNFNLGNAFKYIWRFEHKNGKEDLEKAAEMVSANLSETISRLNDEKRTSNGLMAKMTAQTQKIEELQAEIEAKNAELARVKSEIIAISKVKADTTLKAENQRLKAELELLKRNKFKRGRK